MAEGGFLVINKTLIEIPHTRADIEVADVGITGIAGGLGHPRLANVVVLGSLIVRVPIVERDSAMAALLGLNLVAVGAGMQAAVQTFA